MARCKDFLQLDIEVGKVLDAESRKPAYKLRIDFGPLGVECSSSQITDLYRPEELAGKLVAVVNLPPKRMASFVPGALGLGTVTQGKRPDSPWEQGP